LLTTALRLDSEGASHEVLHFLHDDRSVAEVVHQVYQLLLNSRFLAAYLTACLFSDSESGNAVPWFARSIGGFLFGNPDHEYQRERLSGRRRSAWLPAHQSDPGYRTSAPQIL
jgi:hypothetical protein